MGRLQLDQAQPILKFANFGLRIIEGDADKTYVPNTKVVVADQNNPPKFYAVPIGKENAGFTCEDFTASATMTAMMSKALSQHRSCTAPVPGCGVN